MNRHRYPNNFSQRSSYQNQYRPRPNSGASLARFINHSRFSTPFSGRGHNPSALYQSSAVGGYRTVSPNRFQPAQVQAGQFGIQASSVKETQRFGSSHSEQNANGHHEKRQNEVTASPGQQGNENLNVDQGNKSATCSASNQLESVKNIENEKANLKMAGPSESSNVITNTERQTEGTTETDIKKTGDDNVVAVASGGDDDNVGGGDNDDDSSDEDTSYCKYCKRSFTSSVAYHSHTRGIVHMNLYMEAQAAKTKTQTPAAPEVTEDHNEQVIQPGQIDSFLNEQKQKKLEKYHNRILNNTELDGKTSSIGSCDSAGPSDSRSFERMDNYGNRIREFYNYDNSTTGHGNLVESTNIDSYNTMNDTYGQSSQIDSYVEYSYDNETNAGDRQLDDYYGASASSAEHSHMYRNNEYGLNQQFGRAKSFGNRSHQTLHSQRGAGSYQPTETTSPENRIEEEEEEEEEEEDTSFCKYCQLPFKSAMAYHAHTRGLQHTTLIMEAKEKKGDQRFRKEKVDPDVLRVEIPEPISEKPKIAEADVPDDYDFETNWMNLDEELIKRLKNRTKAAERDLNPDEIGKKQFSDDFTCANMEHLESGNKFKLKQKKSGNTVFASVDGEDVQSQFSQVIGNYKENALLGLEFITEFQKPDPKAACRYVCNLCEAKCDSSTILPHVIGVKHKLHYLRETHYDIYEHLTKYTSKKKRSEMNVNAEDFAKQIEEKEGRKDVKVKIELDAGSAENDLTEIMTRMSKALKEKLQEFENKKDTDETKQPQDSTEKKELADLSKTGSKAAEEKSHETKGSKGSRFTLSDYTGSVSQEPGRHGHFKRPPTHREFEPPKEPPRHWYGPTPRDAFEHPDLPFRDRIHHFESMRHYGANIGHLRAPYSRDWNPHNWDPRETFKGPFSDQPSYDDGRQSRDIFRYEEESLRLDKMLDHRLSDPYDERRRLDDLYYRQQFLREQETRRLDDLLLDRHKLSDPTLETRRLEDIMQRKNKLAEMEKTRLDDIMRRKKILEEHDPEKLRLERYEKLKKTTDAEAERPSMEELIARRRAAAMGAESRPLADHSLLPASYSGHSTSQSEPAAPAVQSLSTQPQGSQAAFNTAQQVVANKELQEELARNPGVNIGELLGNLSSSMIATEDDAAMALQISNALTQALLRFRLQHATKQLSKPESSKPADTKTIPGIGISSGSDSDKSVPSFLRTSGSSTSKQISEDLTNDPSLPHISKKRTSSSLSERHKDTKKARSVLPESSQQTDLLKSIREQAAQLQARISSKVSTSTTVTQHGIQASSQFVHGSPSYGNRTDNSIPGSQALATTTTTITGGAGYVSQESAVTHVNPAFYAHWYKTMYNKDMLGPVPPPPVQGAPPPIVPPLPQPTTSPHWYQTMYGNTTASASQPVSLSDHTPAPSPGQNEPNKT